MEALTDEIAGPRCVACDHESSRRDPFYYDWLGREFWVYRCPACTHQFLWPHVTPEDQRLIFDDQYFAHGGDWLQGPHRGEAYGTAEKLLRKEARYILKLLPIGYGRRLLDVGCAGGVLLDEARSAGFDVEGVEINPAMARQARLRFGLTVTTGRVEDVTRVPDMPLFDVVTLCDVLEHLPRPLATLRKLRHWMPAGGTLLIRGPLHNSAMAQAKEQARRLFRVVKRLPKYPLDANWFNPTSLKAMLKAAGFGRPDWCNRTPDFANAVAVAGP